MGKLSAARLLHFPRADAEMTDTVDGGAVGDVGGMDAASAGWYYDPLDEAVYRFWDGEAWTEQRSDLFPSSQPA